MNKNFRSQQILNLFKMDCKKEQYQKAMEEDKAEGSYFGVGGTPAFIIGKKLISGFVPFETIKGALDEAMKQGS